VHPGLQATLGLHGSGRRINPAGSEKEEHGEQPERRHTDGQPPNNGSEDILLKQASRGEGPFSHLSES